MIEMLDLFQLHRPEDNKDARSWISARGKNLKSQINFLREKLLQTMSISELINLLAEKVDVNLRMRLDNLSVAEWLTQIKELRRKEGLGRHKLEKLTGTSGEDWSKIERGRHIPSCKKLRKIIEVLNLKIEKICYRNDFCLRSIDVIIKSFNSEWVPLVLISTLLELLKERFLVNEVQFKIIKERVIRDIEELKVLHVNSKPVKAVKEIDENVAKIIGAFAADGNFNPPDMIRWEDEYKEQLEVLSKWLKVSFGIKLKIQPSKKRNSFTAKFRSKIFSRYLEVFFDFRPGDKRVTVSEPKLIKEQPLKIRKAFAAGALMFDGSVNLGGNVSFSSLSKSFRDSVMEILLQDGIKLSLPQHPNKKGLWYFLSSRKMDHQQLKKLSFYFEGNTLKRKILDFYLGKFKINNIQQLDLLFPKVRGLRLIDIFKIITQRRKEFDVYELMKETNLSRPKLLQYLQVLEIAGFLTSRRGRRKVYIPIKLSTNFSGS